MRTYWVPGLEGIVLEATLADFIAHQGNARLVISKSSINGKAHYTFDLKKDKVDT